MNCPDCRDRLQQWLDARTREAATTPGEPPTLCPACTEWGAAASRLDRGLRLLAAPTPPALLTARIVARVAAEPATANAPVPGGRRRRRGRGPVPRRVAYVFVGRIRFRPHRTNLRRWPRRPEPPRATLRDSVTEAGSAVASLTTRTADETVANTKSLLPVVTDPTPGKIELEPPPDPPARSLRETGEGVTAGLAPVADSARRAVGLFSANCRRWKRIPRRASDAVLPRLKDQESARGGKSPTCRHVA